MLSLHDKLVVEGFQTLDAMGAIVMLRDLRLLIKENNVPVYVRTLDGSEYIYTVEEALVGLEQIVLDYYKVEMAETEEYYKNMALACANSLDEDELPF